MAKKDINYFGLLKGEKLNEFSYEKKMNHLVSKKLFTTTKKISLTFNTPINLLDASNYETVHEPAKELLESYYNFITHTYLEHINNVLINFFYLFNNQIIGLKKKEVKVISRLLFLNITGNKHSPNFDIVRMLENTHGIPKVDNTPKLELYNIKRGILKHRAVVEYFLGLDEFLMGNSNHFNSKLFEEISIINEVIQFEGELKILLALNDKYKFEKNKTIQSPTIDNTNIEKPNLSINSKTFKNKIPTEEEMDAYLMKHVFSEKKS